MIQHIHIGPRTYHPHHPVGHPRATQRVDAAAGDVSKPYAYTPPEDFQLDRFAQPENLMVALRELQSRGGDAPGPDGISLTQLTSGEKYEMLRVLSRRLINGTYLPGPVREVQIPKPDGRVRTLQLQNIADRIVAKAWLQATTPYWRGLLPRLGQSTWQVLAELQKQMRARGHRVLVIADIRDCFPSVIVKEVIRIHHSIVTDPSLRWLTETMLGGCGDNQSPRTGLIQGSPISPTTMEQSLHFTLDEPFRKRNSQPADPFLTRYADNILISTKNHRESRTCLLTTGELIKPLGLKLKSNTQTISTKSGKAEILGLLLDWKNHQLQYQIPEESFQDLEERLEEALLLGKPDLPRQIITGWITAHGPAFTNSAARQLSQRIQEVILRSGIRDISTEEIENIGRLGRANWNQLYQRNKSDKAKTNRG